MKQLPNIITLINAFMGCLGLVCIFSKQLDYLPYFLGIGLLADFADGLVARALNASSAMGKELDSLADVISFGVLPGAIFYYLINQSQGIEQAIFFEWDSLWGLLGFILTAFAALRLAKFNVDTRQTESFVGLNTPATTLFSFGLLLTVQGDLYALKGYLLQLPVLLFLVALLSFLLVAELPLFSFKFKSLKWKGNEERFIFILIAMSLLASLALGLALMLIIAIYLLMSLLLWGVGRLGL